RRAVERRQGALDGRAGGGVPARPAGPPRWQRVGRCQGRRHRSQDLPPAHQQAPAPVAGRGVVKRKARRPHEMSTPRGEPAPQPRKTRLTGWGSLPAERRKISTRTAVAPRLLSFAVGDPGAPRAKEGLMDFERVLVPLDGSSFAEAALDKAAALSTRDRTTLMLLRAAEAHVLPTGDAVEAQVTVVREAEEYLAGVAARLARDG